MELQTGRGGGPRRQGDGPWRRRAQRFGVGHIQLQGSIRVPDRVVDLLGVVRRECVAAIRSFLIEWRLNVHLGLIFDKKMLQKPPLVWKCAKSRQSI